MIFARLEIYTLVGFLLIGIRLNIFDSMKPVKPKVLIFFLGMAFFTPFKALGQEKNLRLKFESNKASGKVYVAIYDKKGEFLSDKKFKSLSLDLGQGEDEVSVMLPVGNYAFSAYQDVNGNGIFDKNWMGIPKEPYGFSNNARGKFGPPDFAESSFLIRSDTLMKVSLY